MGARGGVHPPAPLPTPAVRSKLAIERGDNISIASSGGILEVPTALEAVEVLAMVSVEEAIAA